MIYSLMIAVKSDSASNFALSLDPWAVNPRNIAALYHRFLQLCGRLGIPLIVSRRQWYLRIRY